MLENTFTYPPVQLFLSRQNSFTKLPFSIVHIFPVFLERLPLSSRDREEVQSSYKHFSQTPLSNGKDDALFIFSRAQLDFSRGKPSLFFSTRTKISTPLRNAIFEDFFPFYAPHFSYDDPITT